MTAAQQKTAGTWIARTHQLPDAPGKGVPHDGISAALSLHCRGTPRGKGKSQAGASPDIDRAALAVRNQARGMTWSRMTWMTMRGILEELRGGIVALGAHLTAPVPGEASRGRATRPRAPSSRLALVSAPRRRLHPHLIQGYPTANSKQAGGGG